MRTPYVIGLKWDHFTTQVEGQVMRDLLTVQNQPKVSQLAVYYEGDYPQFQTRLDVMGIQRAPTEALATLWILYQTTNVSIEAPDHAQEVVVRDMQVDVTDTNQLDTEPHSGFYLAPQGRNISPTLDLNRPMPGWYPGGPTADLVWMWG